MRRNYADVADLTDLDLAQGMAHAGVLFVPRSLDNNQFAATALAISAYAGDHADGLAPNQQRTSDDRCAWR